MKITYDEAIIDIVAFNDNDAIVTSVGERFDIEPEESLDI